MVLPRHATQGTHGASAPRYPRCPHPPHHHKFCKRDRNDVGETCRGNYLAIMRSKDCVKLSNKAAYVVTCVQEDSTPKARRGQNNRQRPLCIKKDTSEITNISIGSQLTEFHDFFVNMCFCRTKLEKMQKRTHTLDQITKYRAARQQ